MIATLAWIAAGVVFTWLVIWGLCKAAANGDILAPTDNEPDDLAEVLHFDCERPRRRGDVRNGISGGAA